MLIKVIVQVISIYAMSIFRFSEEFINEIYFMFVWFLVGSKGFGIKNLLVFMVKVMYVKVFGGNGV